MRADQLSFIAEVTGATRAERGERIQSLWAGCGELFRVRLEGGSRSTAVVKWAKPPLQRTGEPDVSHTRKCRSYDVEGAFYRSFAPRCDETCRVAALLGFERRDGEWLFVLEDLDAAGFSRRVRDPRGASLAACVAWLASFHGRFHGEAPGDTWTVGTYWHLDTRRDELASTNDASLIARAPELDRALSQAKHQTIVHGDAKPANFCFAVDGPGVAAVDFQYAGGGPGIKDLAYLLHGSERTAEQQAVDWYFEQLRDALPAHVDADDVEREWRALYPVAVEDFHRFLVGWRG